MIIYDVEPTFDVNVYVDDNNHKRYISRLKPYFSHKVVGNIIKDVSKEEWYKVHSGMMRYNMSIITMLTENFRSGKDSQQGFSPLSGIYDREPNNTDDRGTYDLFKLGYVEKMVQLVQTKQIPFVVVASPKFGKNSSDDIRPVKDICEQYDVLFLDYYVDSEFMKHKEWFKEPMHLNSVGARVFSSKVFEAVSCFFNM